MAPADPNLLLFAFNNGPEQYATVIDPIVAALRDRFPGAVVAAHVSRLRMHIDAGLTLTLDDVPLRPTRAWVRTFTSAYGSLLAETLHRAGVVVRNDPDAVRTADSKFRTASVLAAAGIPVPQQSTAGAFTGGVTLDRSAPWPRIVKADAGYGGDGVYLSKSPDDACATIGASAGEVHICQEFIAESAGTDIRALVAGGRVVAAVQRTAAPGDFRANLSQGGTSSPVPLAAGEAALAVRAAGAVGLSVAGIDLLRTRRGPVVLEVNANPGLGLMVAAAGSGVYAAVAAAVIDD